MADNLYTYDQIRAALPDNTSNLISPENVRSACLSLAADAGEVGDGGPFLMVLDAGVPSNVNAADPAANSEILRGWAVDGNNALISALSGEFTIQPGTERGVSITAAVVGHKLLNNAATYTFRILKGAVPVAVQSYVVEDLATAGDQLFALNALEIYEPALAEPWSITIESSDGDDFQVIGWDLKAGGIVI